ncbi:MAG: hypothetical protein KGJ93_02030 [Patescibacteria group bacterium]|nr:hypothetical protein [Patescibacteria group bacterium]
MKKIIKRTITGIVILLFFAWSISLFAPKSSTIEYGVTFSAPYAESLGLDARQAYLAVLNELHPKYVRLSAYWDSVEPYQDHYNFSDLDFQVSEAQKAGVQVVLSVGRRLPRWPECHDPGWIKTLPEQQLKTAQLSYVETVVRRYLNTPNIIAWQVENEPFLSTFGICPPLDTGLLDSEIALVKDLDFSRPVIITDSGELDWWLKAGSRGDIFGTTFYRYVFSDVLKRYWTNFYFFPFVYRVKAGLLELLHPGKRIAIMELEAEPWTTAGIPNTPINEQFKTMSMDHFNTIVQYARETGFSPQYLWGAEWWYWMKNHDHPEFWEAAKQLFKK